ncbi:Glutaredoxin [Cladobotryum mycophilum]|uniref:Glutaredoxin n=1 Tax=Cladobotryum mycophilum TaxID=491253 RepID=A0ABR0SVF7_9HYPO
MNFIRSFFTASAARNPETLAMATEKVQTFIDNNAVVIFSKTWCPYCQQAKKTLDGVGAEYTAVELDNLKDGDAFQDALQDLYKQRSVPNIFIAKKHIGGNSDLQTLVKQGKLNGLLKDAGVL